MIHHKPSPNNQPELTPKVSQNTGSHTPVTIKPRRVNFDFSSDIPKYWYGGEAFKTYVADAILSIFTVGEKDLIIYSVKQFKTALLDKKLKEEIKKFVTQENTHSCQHARYSYYLQKNYDHPFLQWDSNFKKFLRGHRRFLSPMNLLALTVCAEHLTAVIAHLTLSRSVLEDADQHIMPFLDWHAFEELEHKGVCFDLYKKLGGGYLRRFFCMPYLLFVLFWPVVILRILAIMRKDKTLLDLKVWARGLKFLVSKQGIPALFGKRFFSFFKLSFHPWQEQADLALIEQYKDKFKPFEEL